MPKYTTADRLKSIMETRGLKQVDIIALAEPYCKFYKIKLGRNDISQYLSGKVLPRQNKLFILGKALNVNEAWLMGYDVPMEKIEDKEAEDLSNQIKVSKIISNRRKELNLTLLDVAKMVGVSEGTISRWESGDISNMRRDRIALLAKALKISPVDLIDPQDELQTMDSPSPLPSNIIPISQLKRKKVPMLGRIACGEPIFADENRNEYVLADGDIKADFCLTCNGDSMTGARINDGDIVFIQQTDMVDNGEIAAVIVEDEATLKRVYYYPEKNKLILNAENPKYEPFVYIGEELDHIRILGRAVAFQSVIR